jgi:hypothetical protein
MSPASDMLALLAAWIVGVGPIAALLALLNRREGRAAALFQAVADALPPEALRSDLSVAIRCGLLGRSATVRLDLSGAPSSRVWETALRLRRALPARVGLVVLGAVDGPTPLPRPVRLTLESAEPAWLRPAA